METMTTSRWARFGAVVGAGALLVGALSGCSAAAGGGGDGSQTDIDAALTDDTTLTWWTWSDSTQDARGCLH